MAANFDRADILRAWNIFRQPGEVLELRIPKAGRYKTISGYFNEPGALADAVIGLADEKFAGIYFTINPVKPDLLARAANRYVKYAESTTSDKDIIVLHWLPVDLDAKRPAGISATDAEHDAALSKSVEIMRWLHEEQSWPAGAFVLADSGNGGHLNIKIDLPNQPGNVALVKGCLEALDFLFSDEAIHVDVTSQNPARIWKLYGTMARKGDSTPERPHRLARLLEVPETPVTVSREQLAALAAMLPRQEEQPKTSGKGFDPVTYCQAHNLPVHHTKTYNGGTLAVLEECIFYPDHKLTACIIGWPSGASTYRCRHRSCLDKHWADAKTIIEPGDAGQERPAEEQAEESSSQEPPFQKMSREDWANYPKQEDLTKATGRMDLINPLTGMKEADPVTGETEIPKLALSPSKACKVITDYMALRIASDDGRENPKLWRCNGKIWKPDGDRQVVNLIDAVLGDLSYDRGLKETLRRIRGVSDTVTFDSSSYLFPALDKVIDLKTGLIRDYQPEDYLTYQYGAAVEDPSADCRPVLWSLCSSAQDPRDVLTALDIATAACIRQPLDAIIQLIGPGANGKGIFERILTALCTASRVAAITLAEAKSSRFGPGAVLGKDIWILSEVEDVSLAINLLKKVATGELMDSDVKYNTERAQGKPHVLPILDCNTAINFGDDSWGRKRRIIKLDYPHTFDYTPGTRRKDPHLKEKVTAPSALAGLLQIIAARAPFLCRSRRIYSRKRPEDMAAEYKRQQDSLKYFCEDCLTTEPLLNAEGRPIDMTTGQPWPGGVIGKLTTDALYTEYMTYCKLLNVPIPAEKSPFGKYINATVGVISVSTTQKGASIRYYPGLMLAKTARLAFAELSSNYTNYNTTTGELQEGIEEKGLLSLLTTAFLIKDMLQKPSFPVVL